MSMNRQKSIPCSTSTPKDDRWPRFLVVEAADDNNKPLTQRSDIFALTKAIEGMDGPYKSVKPMNNGRQLFILTRKYAVTNYYTELTNWMTYPLKLHLTEHWITQDAWSGARNWRAWMKKISRKNYKNKELQKSKEWRGEKMDGWYRQIHIFWQ